jgi:hypothetical protein
LEAARARPDALVLGTPIFDESVPWHRLHGRKLSQVIVWLETLSTSVRDPLCGFRCIPLAATLAVLERANSGDRMDFDPELIIRLVRAGVPVINIPTRVGYPENGVSHFRMVEDNLRIAWAYIRLALASPWRRSRDSGAGQSKVVCLMTSFVVAVYPSGMRVGNEAHASHSALLSGAFVRLDFDGSKYC